MARLDWHQREQLLLEAIRDREDDNASLQNEALEQATGLPAEDVALGLQALLDGRFITGTDMRGMNGPGAHMFGARLAPEGRVRVKQWPGTDAAAALLDAIDHALDHTDDTEQQGKLRRLRTGVTGLTEKVVTELAIAYAKRVSNLDA